MSYKKRDWDTTGNEVTKEDFKRIENGIENNDKQINDCFNNKTITLTNCDIKTFLLSDEAKKNICYRVEPQSTSNVTNGIEPGTWTFYYKRETYIDAISATGNFYRAIMINDDIAAWKQINTTEKIGFSATALTGYEIVNQDCYILNGMSYFNLKIKKIDGSTFTVNNQPVVRIPIGSNLFNVACSAVIKNREDSPILGYAQAMLQPSTHNIWVYPSTDCHFVEISGEVHI